jgi:hypothetical protein
VPHRNYPVHSISHRPDYDNHPVVEITSGDVSHLTIVLAVVLLGDVRPGENFRRPFEIKASRLKRPSPFYRVESDPPHLFIVYTIKMNFKPHLEGLA